MPARRLDNLDLLGRDVLLERRDAHVQEGGRLGAGKEIFFCYRDKFLHNLENVVKSIKVKYLSTKYAL